MSYDDGRSPSEVYEAAERQPAEVSPRRNARRIAAQRSVRIGGQELELGSEVLERAAEATRQRTLQARRKLAPLPPVGERSSTTEAAWQNQIIAVARRLGYYVYHPKLSRWSERGWPDLSLLHSGRRRALFIECKSDTGQLTEQQLHVILDMRDCGLEVHVLRPHDGLERVAELLA